MFNIHCCLIYDIIPAENHLVTIGENFIGPIPRMTSKPLSCGRAYAAVEPNSFLALIGSSFKNPIIYLLLALQPVLQPCSVAWHPLCYHGQ